MKIKQTTVILFILLLGCMNAKSISYESTTREPKGDDYMMEIFESDDINREYKVIGEIIISTGRNKSTQKIRNSLINRAKEMGADAVTDLTINTTGAGNFSGGTGTYVGDARQVWKAKVIVWK